MRRVAVTGLGIVSPLGVGALTNWQSIIEGVSGVGPIRSFDASEYPVRFAGEISDEFDASRWLTIQETRRFDKFIHYGIAAADLAIEESGIDLKSIDLDRMGTCIGSGIGGLSTMEKNIVSCFQDGPRKVSPFYVPGSIINMVSGMVSIRHGFRGPNVSPVSACTTGAHAIAWATRMIQYGDADMMLAGGSEHSCTPSGVAGFNAVRALSKRNQDPTKASRPWDVDRDGFVLSSGAGILLLEELEHAKKRNANIYAELIGVGMSSDAYHITQPSEDGEGGSLCMKRAIGDGKINPQDIQYINAHGTSTPIGDVVEVRAIKKTFEQYARRLAVSSTKSMVGHTLGAAGAIESIYTVLTLYHQQIPPTINLDVPDPECDLDFVPHTARDARISYAMNNSFGFGGANCSLVFARV